MRWKLGVLLFLWLPSATSARSEMALRGAGVVGFSFCYLVYSLIIDLHEAASKKLG